MRYVVQRQDEQGEWQPMAAHNEYHLAEILLTDKHRRIHDTVYGVYIVYTPSKQKRARPPLWDIVGMVLTADWRLVFVIPTFAAFCYAIS